MITYPDNPSCRRCDVLLTTPGFDDKDTVQRCPDANGYICVKCCPTCRKEQLIALIADLESRVNVDAFRLTGLAAGHQEVIRRCLEKARTELAIIVGGAA